MTRGRRAKPDQLKKIQGNPGKRPLTLASAAKAERQGAKLPKLPRPEFLTEPREIEIYRRIVDDYLQRRVARAPDLTAYARWAHYVHKWIKCKDQLEGKSSYYKVVSNHGTRYARHPVFKDQLDLERVLQSLEDRLGLNPTSRQNIIKGLSSMPAALGGLFGDDNPRPDDKGGPEVGDPQQEQPPRPPSPVGLARLLN